MEGPTDVPENSDENDGAEGPEGFYDTTGADDALLSDRETYLANGDVDGFVRFLKGLLTGTRKSLAHSYRHRNEGYDWQCDSLIDAAVRYRFVIDPALQNLCGHSAPATFYDSLSANATVLDALGDRLEKACAAGNDSDARAAAIQIQVWGGTADKYNRGALASFPSGKRDFVEYLNACGKTFGGGLSVNFSHLRIAGFGLRSTAGFSKIYSLYFKDFLIYDSRVAAALGLIIARYWIQKSLHRASTALLPLPSALSLVWLPARVSASGAGVRDPNKNVVGISSFPRVRHLEHALPGSSHREHLLSNIKANWILTAALTGSDFEAIVRARPNLLPVTPLRALEAALFMIGYDLEGNWPY